MNFNEFKDEFLKWIVPVILGGMFYQLSALSNAMIETKARVGFVEYRIDQHRNTLLDHTAKIASQDTKVGILESRAQFKHER